ncbi:hypothetical protein Q3W71_13390 [Micromonospora sp. C28SCA-DRY-2]|uniref:hypothetical protein n=1 Tax=Micromonospora sp. C28SCA-DRY-2 TaxID=3059522 RepID=UPI0026743FC3|nr:hypothetical protein [Micromonospora sp. C28SCA-DRY-2]MDO3702663.1 hypothetical protein [Micromonospora sp. C28SCA-DRY-2]
MAKKRTAAPRQTQAKGAKIVSAYLENADVFRTAKSGTKPKGPAVLVLRNRPDFDKRDFDRKAKDLVRLGQEGRLSKAKSERTSVYHRGGRGTTPGNRSRTNVFRDRVTRRLTRNNRLTQNHGTPATNQYLANKDLVDRLYGGRGPITARGQGLDPDHIHELQLDGKDEYANLRLMDAWTNRELGREISVALHDVPEGTPVIVKVLP